jgi:TolB-like protein/Tfp pilus assembly protein PilF
MGEQSVKNIARPVRADAMSAAAVAATPLVAVQAQPVSPRRSIIPRSAVIAASLIVVIAVGLAAWWVWPHPGPSPAQTSPQSPAANPAPRLSIVVLPFANLSNDPEQEYFADGVTDGLTTDLSRIVNSFVISRTTAFTYKGKPVDVKEIGRELGVRYVLEGSVRRTGAQVEVNVQLIDAESGAHIWADRFDAARADLAKAQDEIVGRLARALNFEIIEAAARRIEKERPVNPDASDYVMRGWAWIYRPVTDASMQEAQRAFERALEIDPQSVDAKIGLARIVSEYVANGRKHVVDGVAISHEQDLARSEQLVQEALERDPNKAMAYFVLGRIRRLQNRLIESRIELEKGVALDRNSPAVMLQLGITLLYSGEAERALPHFEKALQLNPRGGFAFYFLFWVGDCHLLMGHADEAVDFMRKSHAANPGAMGPTLALAAALGFRGDVDEAKAVLAEALKVRPDYNSLAQLRARIENWDASPAFTALREKTIDVGLRRAGMPDE